jgi:hypothetical protein
MKIRDLIYNGHYVFFARNRTEARAMKAAWGICTMALALYVMALYACLDVLIAKLIGPITLNRNVIHLVLVIPLFWLSDPKGNNSWFGSVPRELSPKELRNAGDVAPLFSLGSLPVFLGVNFCLYA